MYIDERGAGRDVVALHGTPQDPEELADFAAGALPDARVLTPHLPGYGRSRELPLDPEDPVSLGALEARLARELRGPAVLFGVSGGAYRALALAARGRLPVAGVFALAGFRRLDEALAERLRGGAAAVEVGVDLSDALVGSWFAPAFARRQRATAEAIVERYVSSAHAPTLVEELRALASGADLEEGLARFSRPVELQVGALDEATPPALSEEVAACCPAARLVRLEGRGHLAHVEAPQQLGAALRAFAIRAAG
ncbi:MAG: hypothetical protein CMN31_19520 [Sandaracinus sp.]|nr:hypothetical protein [Sandaracinus sp.]